MNARVEPYGRDYRCLVRERVYIIFSRRKNPYENRRRGDVESLRRVEFYGNAFRRERGVIVLRRTYVLPVYCLTACGKRDREEYK